MSQPALLDMSWAKAAERTEKREAELLGVEYHHVVFTLPHEIAALAMGNKKLMYGMLMKCASQTITTVGATAVSSRRHGTLSLLIELVGKTETTQGTN